MTGGIPPDKQIELACFLLAERSNHVTGKVVHVNDDWRRLEKGQVNPELYTLRRVVKV
jgi:predicted transcriptional regulator